MRNRTLLVTTSIAVLTLASVPALTSAAAIEAAQTGVVTLFPCPSFCGGPGTRIASDLDGGLGLTTSFSSLNNIDGNGQARADLTGPTELPVLRAEAFSQANSNATAEAAGMQGFFYNGGGSGTYMLDVTLLGIANDPNPSPLVTDGSLFAHVLIFRDNNPATDTGYSSDYATLKSEIILLTSDLEELADAGTTLKITADNVVHSVSTTLSVSGLNAGDLIYVWASLTADGTRGGFGNGFSTLTMEFQDPTGLSHTPVPVPAAWVLFGPAALLLGLRRLRGQG